MIWARRRFKWDEYGDYQDRIGDLLKTTPTLQLQQQFMMVNVETGDAGVSDHYIGLPNQAFLSAFDGFEVVSEDQLPKEIDGVSVASNPRNLQAASGFVAMKNGNACGESD